MKKLTIFLILFLSYAQLKAQPLTTGEKMKIVKHEGSLSRKYAPRPSQRYPFQEGQEVSEAGWKYEIYYDESIAEYLKATDQQREIIDIVKTAIQKSHENAFRKKIIVEGVDPRIVEETKNKPLKIIFSSTLYTKRMNLNEGDNIPENSFMLSTQCEKHRSMRVFPRDRSFKLQNEIVIFVPLTQEQFNIQKVLKQIVHGIGHLYTERRSFGTNGNYWSPTSPLNTTDLSNDLYKNQVHPIAGKSNSELAAYVFEYFVLKNYPFSEDQAYKAITTNNRVLIDHVHKLGGPVCNAWLNSWGKKPNTEEVAKMEGREIGVSGSDLKIHDWFIVDKRSDTYNVTWDHIFQMENVPEMKGFSCWSAAAATLVIAADLVKLVPVDITQKIGYWAQFRPAYTKNDKHIFGYFKLDVTQKQLETPEQLLQFLNDNGPFVVGIDNHEHARVVTGMSYNKSNNTYAVKIFDPRPKGKPKISEARLLNNSGSIYVESFKQFVGFNRIMAGAKIGTPSPMLTLAHLKRFAL